MSLGTAQIPVFALPMTSLPANAWGMVARCTSVIVTKFAFFSAVCVLKDSGSSANRRAAAYPAVSTVASDLSKARGLLPGGGACCTMRSCSIMVRGENGEEGDRGGRGGGGGGLRRHEPGSVRFR